MLRVCSYCRRSMGSKEPLGDPSVSHGCCNECFRREVESLLADAALPDGDAASTSPDAD